MESQSNSLLNEDNCVFWKNDTFSLKEEAKKQYKKHGVFIFNDEVIYLTIMIKGKVTLFLFSPFIVIPWPIHFP